MRRIRQHNGEIEGGAKKTSKKRPWTMVLVVMGFTSRNAALRFEWAWQNPKQSLLTRDAVAMLEGLGAQDHVRTKLHILYAMLGVEPFVRFPLSVNFFTNSFNKYLEGCSKPPPQVKIQNGPPDALYIYNLQSRLKLRDLPECDPDLGSMCDICGKTLPTENDPECAAECVYDGCPLRCHVNCLATRFLANEPDQLVPTLSSCPLCSGSLTWGQVVVERQKRKKAKLKELNMTF